MNKAAGRSSAPDPQSNIDQTNHEKSSLPLWKNKNYILWFVGHTFTDVGSSLTAIALPLLILALTGSTEFAGTLAALSMVLATLMSTPAGIVADSFDRRKIVIVTVPIAAIAYGVLGWLSWMDMLNIPVLMVLVLTGTAASSISGQARRAMMRVLAPNEQFPTIVSAEQGRAAAIELAGGPAGGFLFSLQQGMPFAARGIGYVVSFFAVLGMKADFRPAARRQASHSEEPVTSQTLEEKKTLWQRAFAGFAVMVRVRGILATSVSAAFANLAVNAYVTTLIYSWYEDGVEPWIIGLVTTGFFAGVLGGTILAPKLVRGFATGSLSLVAFLMAVLGFLPGVFGAPIYVILAGLLLAALSFPAFNAGMSGYQVAAVSNEHQGRVQAATDLIGMVLMPLAPLIAGFGLGLWGGQITTLIILIVALVGLSSIAISSGARRIPKPDQWAEYAAKAEEK